MIWLREGRRNKIWHHDGDDNRLEKTWKRKWFIFLLYSFKLNFSQHPKDHKTQFKSNCKNKESRNLGIHHTKQNTERKKKLKTNKTKPKLKKPTTPFTMQIPIAFPVIVITYHHQNLQIFSLNGDPSELEPNSPENWRKQTRFETSSRVNRTEFFFFGV